VVRRLLLAVLFCLASWAMADRAPVDPVNPVNGVDSHATATAAAVATMTRIGANVATPPIDTHPPEARWEALLPPGVAGGSSRHHQPQAQAVDLPGVSSRVPWPVACRSDAAGHSARFRPHHLLNTPLLI
jgi:hypothetical protein